MLHLNANFYFFSIHCTILIYAIFPELLVIGKSLSVRQYSFPPTLQNFYFSWGELTFSRFNLEKVNSMKAEEFACHTSNFSRRKFRCFVTFKRNNYFFLRMKRLHISQQLLLSSIILFVWHINFAWIILSILLMLLKITKLQTLLQQKYCLNNCVKQYNSISNENIIIDFHLLICRVFPFKEIYQVYFSAP